MRLQVIVFGILIFLAVAAAAYTIWFAIPSSTCFDSRQNSEETGVDCGGSCQPCLANLSEPVVLWARFFKLTDGLYDGAALVENIHATAAAGRVLYRMKLYDAKNVLIALRE